jgi:hypothetical protein
MNTNRVMGDLDNPFPDSAPEACAEGHHYLNFEV